MKKTENLKEEKLMRKKDKSHQLSNSTIRRWQPIQVNDCTVFISPTPGQDE